MKFVLGSMMAAVLLVGCKVEDPLQCQASSQCNDPARPFCDRWGAFDDSNGIPNTCIPDPEGTYCQTDADVCYDGVLYDCNAGELATVTPCAFGCAEQDPRCLEVTPTGIPDGLIWSGELQTFDYSTPITINTNNGTLTSGSDTIQLDGEVTPAPEGGVPVFRAYVDSLSVADVTVEGDNALAIYARGPITIGGIFDIGRSGRASELLCQGAWPTENLGAGFGGLGGLAGIPDYSRRTVGNAPLSPLRGGCGVGAGGGLQLVSRDSIELTSGYISAVGRGGASTFDMQQGSSRTGGYSGGGVLLEAPTVRFAAQSGITANGGGGGCYSDFLNLRPGQDGQFSTNPAEGGCFAAGSGGVLGSPDGGNSNVQGGAAEPGGGGVGRIRINTASGEFEAPDALITPAPSIGFLRLR